MWTAAQKQLADGRPGAIGEHDGAAGFDHGRVLRREDMVPRLRRSAAMPITEISKAAARPTTTIFRWVVRSAVYMDQFMATSEVLGNSSTWP